MFNRQITNVLHALLGKFIFIYHKSVLSEQQMSYSVVFVFKTNFKQKKRGFFPDTDVALNGTKSNVILEDLNYQLKKVFF